MQRAVAWALVMGGAIMAGTLLALVPAVLGDTVYTARLGCLPSAFSDGRTPDDAFQLPLVEGEEVRFERPDAPHLLLVEADALISRVGDERASWGYRSQACSGGEERVLARGDGTLQVRVWRFDAEAS